uniref:NAD(+) ADP-ribosyltransferase n=1 Tax=Lotharella oceanica TaxID=641309 RepID=A0A7S2XHE4_9EUKA|mmetsp:Transcript_35266/g.65339  ORF Transcript_35266/g.65339 Transcript_35266/m.65339 type:complete len:176 (+) Transcript_35266:2-529(+)
MAASSNGHLACSRYLVTCKACLNIQERSGWTALMLAARSGKMDVVEYLIAMGADVKPRTSNSITVYGLGRKQETAEAIRRGLQRRREREAGGCVAPWLEHIIDWQFEDVSAWLRAVNCVEVQDVFRENMVDGEALLDFSDEDFDDLLNDDKLLDLDPSVRNRVKQAICSLRGGPE